MFFEIDLAPPYVRVLALNPELDPPFRKDTSVTLLRLAAPAVPPIADDLFPPEGFDGKADWANTLFTEAAC